MIKPKGAEGKRKMESIDSRIPKKPKQVGFSDKQCALCKKQGGQYKSRSTHDCCKYNSDSTPSKRNGGAGSASSTRRNKTADKHRSNQRKCEGAYFPQIICKEVKKAFRNSSLVSTRNVVQTTQKVTVIPTTAHEDTGRMAQWNQVNVRNVN